MGHLISTGGVEISTAIIIISMTATIFKIMIVQTVVTPKLILLLSYFIFNLQELLTFTLKCISYEMNIKRETCIIQLVTPSFGFYSKILPGPLKATHHCYKHSGIPYCDIDRVCQNRHFLYLVKEKSFGSVPLIFKNWCVGLADQTHSLVPINLTIKYQTLLFSSITIYFVAHCFIWNKIDPSITRTGLSFFFLAFTQQ